LKKVMYGTGRVGPEAMPWGACYFELFMGTKGQWAQVTTYLFVPHI
jgi:hypothetical protein